MRRGVRAYAETHADFASLLDLAAERLRARGFGSDASRSASVALAGPVTVALATPHATPHAAPRGADEGSVVLPCTWNVPFMEHDLCSREDAPLQSARTIVLALLACSGPLHSLHAPTLTQIADAFGLYHDTLFDALGRVLALPGAPTFLEVDAN